MTTSLPASKGGPPGDVVTSEEPDQKPTHCCDKVFACGCCGCLEKASDAIIGTMEKGFYKLGYAIGRYPWAFIVGVFVFFLIFIPGVFVNFYEETDPTNLWTPLGIDARDDKAWVEEHYQSTARFNGLIVEADNVLKASVIKKMFSMDKKIKAISGEGYNWEGLCARLGPNCWSNSLLEIWSFDEDEIDALNDAQVLSDVNSITVSPVYYNNYTVENLLGDISRDDNGDITGAMATTMSYFLDVEDIFDVPETDPVYDFEKELIEIAQEDRDGMTVYIFAGRSFGDEAGGAILGDINILFAGYILVIVFVCVAIGRFSCVQQKIYLTLGGILCIGLSIGFAMGLCAYASINWGPLHNVLPFLVLGIGVDDMFVIVQNWENLSEETHKTKSIPERIGLTLKHAGVSITVTSITDILAFAVGASTILPALRSFCIYSALCIFACFVFQVLLFVACLAYDQRRAEAERNACCCCYVHKNYQASKCSQKSFVVSFFERFFAPVLVKLPVKIAVILVALGLFAGGLYGTIQMEQFFDAKWFIPSDSYLSEYFDKSEEYFPEGGLDIAVYTGTVDYHTKETEMETLYQAIVDNEFTQTGSVDSWFQAFTSWLDNNAGKANVNAMTDSDNYPTSSENFYTLLNIFLYNSTGYTGDGTRFVRDIIFNDDGQIDAAKITFRQPLQTGTTEQIESMDSIRTVCEDTDLGDSDGNCIVYSPEFLNFEGDKVIKEELFRNLGLAFMCVVLMTLILLANIWGCLLVSVCVVMSLVDVIGFMHFWGLTIDTVSTINLIIAIGLTVDYSAHIAHTFMTEVGDRNDRVVRTMSLIGPAVFYGGFSTFLAFILLAASASYVFSTFFKIFLLVVVWGLFHGMMVLPVLLSWVGPPPYLSAVKNAKEGEHKKQLGNGKVNTSHEDLHMRTPPPKYEEQHNGGMANPAFTKDGQMNGVAANETPNGTVDNGPHITKIQV